MPKNIPLMDHDRFFRVVFGKPEQAASLLRYALPSEALESLDLEHLVPMPESFVTSIGASGRGDLFFHCPVQGAADKKLLIAVLFEHKSYPDAESLSQMARYWANLVLNLDPAVIRVDSTTIPCESRELTSAPMHPPSAPSGPPHPLSSQGLGPILSRLAAGTRLKDQPMPILPILFYHGSERWVAPALHIYPWHSGVTSLNSPWPSLIWLATKMLQ